MRYFVLAILFTTILIHPGQQGRADDGAPAKPEQADGRGELAKGLRAMKQKSYQRAVVHLTAAIRSATLEPRQLSDAHYFRGRALVRVQQRDLALADFDQAVLYWPENVKALRVRCRALALEKQWERATGDCDTAVALAPGDWRGWFTRGLLRREQDRRDEAKGDFAAALMRMPDGMTSFPMVRRPLREFGLIEGYFDPAEPAPDLEDIRAGD